MKYTTSVTISRRGTSLVTGYMLLNTATSTKIGIAFSATATGLNRSSTSRKRASRKAIPTPLPVPTSSPTNAVRPDTLVASQINDVVARNASQIAEGAGRKYGWKSKTLTAASHNTRNTAPNNSGGHTSASACPGE